MEERQSELDPLRFHAAAAALRRGVDRLGPCRPRARRAAPEGGGIRRLPRPCRAQGARLHAGGGRARGAKGAPDTNGAMGLIDYLTRPETQIETARNVGFLPVVKAEVPPDTEPGLKPAVAAVERMQSAKDALPALLATGLGEYAGEFALVFMDAFNPI